MLLPKRAGNYASHASVLPELLTTRLWKSRPLINLTTCNLAQKVVCLEDIEGGKFVVVYASAESAKDNRFLQSVKNTTFSSSLVPCVVDDSHTVET